jgi:hypothetical protein
LPGSEGYFKWETASDHPVTNDVKCQERMADSCDVGLGNLLCAVNKIKSYFNARGGMNFKLSGKNWQKRRKTAMDNFDREAA